MKKVKLNNYEYDLVENTGNCFNLDEVLQLLNDIDYFDSFDYIFGDYSYGKVRLKGFYDDNNTNANSINSIAILADYKTNYCSYGAKSFLLKKIK